MPPAGYPAFLQYLQSGRVRQFWTPFESAAPGLVRAPPPSSRAWGNEGLLPGPDLSGGGGEIAAGLAALDAVHGVTVAGVPPHEGDEGPVHYYLLKPRPLAV